MFRQEISRKIISVDQEPRSKNQNINDQRIFREKLKDIFKSPLKGDLAISITAHSCCANPPHIKKIVKNYLDLMHKSMPKVDSLSEIAFYDDSQVRYLSAIQYKIKQDPKEKQKKEEKPSIFIEVISYRRFLRLMELHEKSIPDDDPYEDYGEDAVETYRQTVKNQGMYEKVLSTKGYDAMLEMDRMYVQKEFLKKFTLKASSVIALHSKEFKRNVFIGFSDVFSPLNDLILGNAVNALTIPKIPRKERDSDIFMAQLKLEAERFMKSFAILFPLNVPISLRILYIPPNGHSKDIDNIVLKIANTIVNKFDPPERLRLNSVDSSEIKFPLISINRYEVLRLSPIETEEQGKLMIYFSDPMFSKTIWDELWEK